MPKDSGREISIDRYRAPFAGFASVKVAVGDGIEAGAVIAVVETVKMEAAIVATESGEVRQVAVPAVGPVEGGDFLVFVSDRSR